MKKHQNGLIIICAQTDEELSKLALSTFNAQLTSASNITIFSKRDRFTESDLAQIKVKNAACIYHLSFDTLNIKNASRFALEALRLSPKIIYFDDFDYGPAISSILKVAQSSHLIILGIKNCSPNKVIIQLSMKFHGFHCFDNLLSEVIAPSYKAGLQNHQI